VIPRSQKQIVFSVAGSTLAKCHDSCLVGSLYYDVGTQWSGVHVSNASTMYSLTIIHMTTIMLCK
jgi:hypothetical protein